MSKVVYELFNNAFETKPYTLHHLPIMAKNKSTNVFINWHIHPEIIYAASGSGKILCDCKTLPIKQGDIVFINSEELHDIITDDYIDCYSLIVDAKYLKEQGINLDNIKFEELISDRDTAALYCALVDADDSDAICKPLQTRYALLGLMLNLYKYHLAERDIVISQNINTIRIKEIINYIKMHFVENITLDDIAKDNNISKFYLSHEFKRHTDTSVIEYINNLRCLNARSMIKCGFSVSQAALSSGFENMSYFSKTYKKYIGCLPSEDKI